MTLDSNGKDQNSKLESLEFENRASAGEFVGLGFKNTLMGIITLTLYRFWGRTEVRKRIWANTFLNNEPFEYTGKGGELFKGFLLAIALFTIPYLVLIFVAQLMPPIIAGIIFIAYFFGIFLIIGAAIWLAFRYLASRTTWRGIRFKLGGKPFDFSLMYFKQGLLQAITLGWWSPKVSVKIAKELWGNMHFGNLKFEFDETKIDMGKLFKLFAIGWVGIVIGDIIFISALGEKFLALSNQDLILQDPEKFGKTLITIYAYAFLFAIFVFFAFMAYRVEVLKSIAKAISLDGANFTLDFKISSFIVLWITNILIIIFSLGICYPVVQARSVKFLINNLKSDGKVDFTKIEQTDAGPDQAEGLSDALDIGII